MRVLHGRGGRARAITFIWAISAVCPSFLGEARAGRGSNPQLIAKKADKKNSKTPPAAPQPGDETYAKAKELLGKEEFAKAIPLFDQAFITRQQPEIRCFRGEAHRALGHYEEALNDYQACEEGLERSGRRAQIGPFEPTLLSSEQLKNRIQEMGQRLDALQSFKAGENHLTAGEYTEAALAFESAYRSDPRPQYLYALGQALEKAHDGDKALTAYDQLLDQYPEPKKVPPDLPSRDEILQARDRLRKAAAQQHDDQGQKAYREKRYFAAEAEFSQALAFDPDPGTLCRLGYAILGTQQLERARHTVGQLYAYARDWGAPGPADVLKQTRKCARSLSLELKHQNAAWVPPLAIRLRRHALNTSFAGGAVFAAGAALIGVAGWRASLYNEAYRLCFPTATERCTDPVQTRRLRTLAPQVDGLVITGAVLLGVGAVVGGLSGYLWWRAFGERAKVALAPNVLPGGAGIGLAGVWP